MGISAILMASGLSKRMGENKLFLELEGRKIYTYAMELLKGLLEDSYIDEVIIVSSYQPILDQAANMDFKAVNNKKNSLGQSSSIILGIGEAKESNDYLFMVADQPLLKIETVRRLIDKFNTTNLISMTSYEGIPGNPVIFPNLYKNDLLQLSEDQGGRSVIRQGKTYLTVSAEEYELFDLDNREDYLKLKEYLKERDKNDF